MNTRMRAMCLLILGLLWALFTVTATQAREAQEDSVEPADERTLVYDYKSGTFVRVHKKPRFSDYRVGPLKLDVGYDEQIHRTTDAWSDSVTRYLFRRPLD